MGVNCHATSTVNEKFDRRIRKKYKNISQVINLARFQKEEGLDRQRQILSLTKYLALLRYRTMDMV